MAFRNNVTIIVMLVVLLVAAMVGPTVHAEEGGDCFCRCMKNKCMILGTVSRQGCAQACDQMCISLAYFYSVSVAASILN
ncbi:hypothetical protein FCM35_KLT09421 [Carex littledalei]|uniref:Thionin-like protein n=1 Tax=Carex littledalei TaxID=544730 RepID=A0A833RGJ2_9POAL|nr:hypothetical protein FCM35_KLT09421 [Carex littledalei]